LEVVVKTPLLPPPSTGATVNDAAIGAISSIPRLLPSTTTPITTINDHHRGCHTVDNNNHQKPVVVVHCRWQQWWPYLTEAAVGGNRSNGGLC
jgi:hypothetical protein